MSSSAILQLKDVFSRLIDMKFDDDLRMLCSSALFAINEPRFQTPIISIENPLIRAIDSMCKSDNYRVYAKKLALPLVTGILEPVFCDHTLDFAERSVLELLSTLDDDTYIDLLNYLSNHNESLVSLKRSSFTFSLIIESSFNKSALVSSTAMALYQQLLIVWLKDIENNETYCTSIEIEHFFQISLENSSKYVDWIIMGMINALFSKLFDRTSQYIRIKGISKLVMYDIIELTIFVFKDAIHRSINIYRLLESYILLLINDLFSVFLIITFLHNYGDMNPDFARKVFVSYIQMLDSINTMNHSLYFFKSFFIASPELSSVLLLAIDKNFDLIKYLMETLKKLFSVQMITNVEPLSIKHSRMGFGQIIVSGDSMLKTYPLEISACLINTIYISELPMGGFINPSLVLFEFIIAILKYSDIGSFNIGMNTLWKYLMLLHRSEIRTSVLHNFHDLLSFQKFLKNYSGSNVDEKRFLISEKNNQWDRFLVLLVHNCHCLCQGNWLSIIESLKSRFVHLFIPTFANSFSLNDKEEILQSLLDSIPHEIGFITDFIFAEISSFFSLSIILEKYFQNIFKQREPTLDSINLYVLLMSKCFSEYSDEYLLKTALGLLNPKSNLKNDDRMQILMSIHNIFSQSLYKIKKGWDYLFLILSPDNFVGNDELQKVSFRILSNICNDHLSQLDTSSLRLCIETIFLYVDLSENINISLSSFDLLWIITRSLENSVSLWSAVFTHFLKLLHHSKSPIALGSANYIFSLLTTEFKSIPSEVLSELVSYQIFEALLGFEESNSSHCVIIQTFLQEIVHFISNYWIELSAIDSFLNELVPFVISKHKSFSLSCDNIESISNGLETTFTFMSCKDIDLNSRKLVILELESLCDSYVRISDPNSLVLATYGRVVGKIILNERERFIKNAESESDWITLLTKIAHGFRSTKFVHLTTSRVFDAILKLYPINGSIFVDMIVGIILESSDIPLILYLFGILVNIHNSIVDLDEVVMFLYSILKLYSNPQSKMLFSNILIDRLLNCQSKHDTLYICCKSIVVNDELLVVLFEKLSKENKIDMIISYNFQIIFNLWERYCSPNSSSYSLTLYNELFDAFIESFRRFKYNIDDEKESLLDVMIQHIEYQTTEKNLSVKLFPTINSFLLTENQTILEKIHIIFQNIASYISLIK